MPPDRIEARRLPRIPRSADGSGGEEVPCEGDFSGVVDEFAIHPRGAGHRSPQHRRMDRLPVELGLGPMAAGYALWTRAMSGGGADRLSPLGYATPLLSTTILLATGAPAGLSTLAGVGLA